MKQMTYLLILFFTMNGTHSLLAQSYDTLWKRVADFEKRDLPQSALKEATLIYEKAQEEQQLPQMMKAYLTAMQYRSRISPDSLPLDRQKLLQWAEESQRIEEKAILFSILGEIMPRSEQKVAYDYMVRSLQQPQELLKISANSYLPLVEQGERSERYGANNLYDLVARRALDWLQSNQWSLGSLGPQSYTLPDTVTTFATFVEAELLPASPYDGKVWALQIYQSLLHAYHSAEQQSAWLLTAMDAWSYLKEQLNFLTSPEAYANNLISWSERYKEEPATAYLCAELASHYMAQQKMVEALKWVKIGMQRYPKSEALNKLKNLEQQVVEPSLSAQFPALYPGVAQQATLTYKNLTQLSLAFYRLNLPVTSPLLQDATHFSAAQIKKHGVLERKQQLSLPATPDYLPAEQAFTIEPLQPGIYLVQAIDAKNQHLNAATFLYVSSLKVIHRNLPNGEKEMVVVDAESGHPVKGSEVVTFTRQDNLLIPAERYGVNDEGVAHLAFIERYSLTYHVVTPRDSYMPVTTLWDVVRRKPGLLTTRIEDNDATKGGSELLASEQYKEQIELFTDRGIYRPGQTIQLGGVLYKQLGDDTQTVMGRELEVRLFDSNYQEVATLKCKSNRYGSFGGAFTLPTSLLPGRFTIQVEKQRRTVVVEEYKRPTFDVKLTPPTVGYKAGDSIALFGVAKTYSEVPVAHASVTYQIERSGSWRWFGTRASWSGKTVTDSQGNFTIPVQLLLDPSDSYAPWFYNFRITATVTSGAGESQVGSYGLPLGKTAWVMELEGWNASRCEEQFASNRIVNNPSQPTATSQLWKEQEEQLTIKLTNLVGKPITKEVAYAIYTTTLGGKREKLLLQGEVVANLPFTLPKVHQLPSGKYLLVASITDEMGQKVTQERSFILLSKNEKSLPFSADSWFSQVGSEFNEKQPVALYVGTSQQDVYLMYDLFAGDKLIDSQRILLSDSIVKFEYPYQSVYGEGIRATFAFVKQGQLYSYVADVLKPQPEKRLNVTWESFRNYLNPGSQEVWKLKVTHPDGTPADAALMATLYDASLEALASHAWGAQPRFTRFLPAVWWNQEVRNAIYLSLPYKMKRWEEAFSTYNELRIPDELKENNRIWVRGVRSSNSIADGINGGMPSLSNVVAKEALYDAVEQQEASLLPVNPSVQLRQHFAESAFFYPSLQTDADGVVTLTFTLPESLTTWKFKGYAHTSSMENGVIEEEIVATKKVMLESNLPRFVRAGDSMEFVATVMNRSDQPISGTVRMELFQPETNKVVASKRLSFKADSLESVHLSFSVTVAKEERLLACRLVAEGKGFSDGEQRYLPVLSDKQWVTETIPFYINQAGTQTIALNQLFNRGSANLTNQRLTLEFTAHPIWYVVQALPLLATPTTDDGMAWAAALYAATLSNQIISSHPQLKQVIASLQATGSLDENRFWSELQKNGELKGTLFSETPWLQQATDEAEQRRRLATLLDVNGVAQQQRTAIQQLQQLQQADGSFSWYPGMEGNGYVTTYIAQLLVRMQLVAPIQNQAVEAMLAQAMSYLQGEVSKEYLQLKEKKNSNQQASSSTQQSLQEASLPSNSSGQLPLQQLSSQAVNYLYLCSLNKQWIKDVAMHNYLVKMLASHPLHYSIEEKATAVVILQAAGESKVAQSLLASILEYSVSTPEMGRYFDTNRAHYSPFDHKIPTQVAVIEAIQVMGGEKQVVEELKQWLLQQKQSQLWSNSMGTTDAIYALLQTQTEPDALPNKVTFQLGKEELASAGQNPWGYTKQTIPVEKGMPKVLQVTSEKKSLGWGAIYAQYLAPIADIVGQSSGLHLTRTLLRNGVEVVAGDNLEPGDEITVRLTLRADRTIDFVEVKEWGAACFEPQSSASGYRYQGGIGCYAAMRDASVSFYLDRLPKGEYQLEYKVYVAQRGSYQGGIATVQSAYAPQFAGHAAGYVVTVQ